MMQISDILEQHQLSDLKATDANGDTILHLVVKNEKSTSKETIELLKLLLDEGLDPNTKNHNDETVLHLAVASRLKDVIEFLLERQVHFEDSVAVYLIDKENDKTVELQNDLQMSDNERLKMESDSTDFVEWIVSKGLNVNGPSRYGDRAVFFALVSNLLHLLPTILRNTNEIDHTEDRTERTLLHIFLDSNAETRECYKDSGKSWYPDYIRRYATSILKILLDRGISPEAVDVHGNTALHLALDSEEDINIIEMIIEHSSNVNRTNSWGNTPLYIAVYKWVWSEESKADRYLKICQALIDKGADVNESSKSGYRPLCSAFQRHHLQAVEFLLENGADLSVTTESGEPLLHLLVNKSHAHKIDDEMESKLFDILICNGCQVNAKDAFGQTALHKAANSDDIPMVRKLIENGIDVNVRNSQKKTPLIYLATYTENTNAAKLLLEHGANINAKDFDGCTALHATASVSIISLGSGKIKMLQFLLKHGADFNARDDEGHSVLRMALWRDYNGDWFDEDSVDPRGLPSLATCMRDYTSEEIEFLLKHWIKLHVANLKCHTDSDYKNLIKKKKYKKYLGECMAEIETLKTTFIDSHTSLYTFLHKNLNNRRAYIHSEKLQQLLVSPKLEEQYPEFSILICSSYHEAVTRNLLLEPAKQVWLELTKISLPEECLELIFSFLSNSNLFDMIEKN